MRLSTMIRKAARIALVRTLLRNKFLPVFAYNMRAPQLCFLAECIERTRDVPGVVIEVGVARGWTTLFLNDYMTARGIEKPYVCLDTFGGFMSSDIAFEVETRGKRAADYTDTFNVDSRRIFEATLELNRISRAKIVQADAASFDYAS